MGETSATPVIPLTVPIETRDGTLAKDAKMVNCFGEQTENGWATRKRPGTTIGASVPTGTPQGIGLHNGGVWAVVSDKAYRIDQGGAPSPVDIPGLTTYNSQYQVVSDASFGVSYLKSAYGLWVIDITVITKVTDVNYPTLTSYGVAWLDGTTYVLDVSGTISGRSILRGSDLDDPTTWDPLNFIEIPTSTGVGVAIGNYLNYVAVFTENGLQMFYDAGNPTGSPLSPVSNASWLTGCGSAATIVKVVDDLYFLSQSSRVGYGITVLRGLTLSKVSTPAIDRILNRAGYVATSAQTFIAMGCSFYAVTGAISGNTITLCYNITTQHWSQWTSVVSGTTEVGFLGIHAITKGQTTYMQDALNGTCLLLKDTAYQDGTGTIRGAKPIYARVVTHPWDWNSLKRKFLNAIYLLGDTVAATCTVRYSDDDYTTRSTWRTIDLSTLRKMALRMGSSRRRSWEILHTANTPCRLYGIEIEVEKSGE